MNDARLFLTAHLEKTIAEPPDLEHGMGGIVLNSPDFRPLGSPCAIEKNLYICRSPEQGVFFIVLY